MGKDKERGRKYNWDLGEDPDSDEYSGVRTGEISDVELQKLKELLERAIPMIEQVNSLYNQYRAGAERRPPIERRNALDQTIKTIQFIRKPTEDLRFQVRQVVAKFLAYKDRWDRLLRSMESGRGPIVKPPFRKKMG